MRKLIHISSLIIALLLLAGCVLPAQETFLMPEIRVTPAKAPITIPGETPAIAPPSPSPTPPPNPTPRPSAVPTPTLPSTTAPQRTPIRIKVPASALVQPIISPTIVTETLATDGNNNAEISALTPSPSQKSPPPPTATTEILPSPSPSVATLPSPSPTLITLASLPTPTLTPVPAKQPSANASPTSLEDTLNILVVGSDERSSGNPWRSDVIMVVAVDFSQREVGVISFPRDLYVNIPTVGDNRINTATFFGQLNKYKDGGGIGLLSKTIEKNFGIRIDHYVKVNFSAFKDLVDALGGIDVTVDCPISGRFPREPGSQELVYQTLQPGKYHMDGLFALRYSRERKSTSDVDRTRRQQRVLIAIRNRAREVNIIPRLLPLYDALSKSIDTDLGLSDIIALARLGIQIEPSKAHGFIIGFKETDSWTTPSGAYVLLPKMNKINERILNLFNEPSILKNPQKPRNCKTAN